MVVKTLEDCINCEVVSICDAHNINGKWKHKLGANPCEVEKHVNPPTT
jgi:hypothetical protein